MFERFRSRPNQRQLGRLLDVAFPLANQTEPNGKRYGVYPTEETTSTEVRVAFGIGYGFTASLNRKHGDVFPVESITVRDNPKTAKLSVAVSEGIINENGVHIVTREPNSTEVKRWIKHLKDLPNASLDYQSDAAIEQYDRAVELENEVDRVFDLLDEDDLALQETYNPQNTYEARFTTDDNKRVYILDKRNHARQIEIMISGSEIDSEMREYSLNGHTNDLTIKRHHGEDETPAFPVLAHEHRAVCDLLKSLQPHNVRHPLD